MVKNVEDDTKGTGVDASAYGVIPCSNCKKEKNPINCGECWDCTKYQAVIEALKRQEVWLYADTQYARPKGAKKWKQKEVEHIVKTYEEQGSYRKTGEILGLNKNYVYRAVRYANNKPKEIKQYYNPYKATPKGEKRLKRLPCKKCLKEKSVEMCSLCKECNKYEVVMHALDARPVWLCEENRHKGGRGKKKWEVKEVEYIVKLYKEKNSYRKIATLLGKDKNYIGRAIAYAKERGLIKEGSN